MALPPPDPAPKKKKPSPRRRLYTKIVKASPPDRERASSVGPQGRSTDTTFKREPTYKPKKGYRDAPGATRYGGNYAYDSTTGRRKI